MLSSFSEMTYTSDSNKSLDLAEQRWDRLSVRYPDLLPAIEMQRRVIKRSVKLGLFIDQKLPVTFDLDSTAIAAKLERKIPVLIDETIEVDSANIEPFVLGFCEDLASGEAGGSAVRLGTILEQGQIHIGSLLAASLGRKQEAIRTKAHHLGIAPDLLWLVAELAAGPVANRLQHKLLTELHQKHEIRPLPLWDGSQGFCAACGSWPTFRERILNEREEQLLRCSFCGAAWTNIDTECIYCDTSDASPIKAASDPEQSSEHLELCQHCGGYLKCIAVHNPTPFELLPIEDLGTSQLDLGAVEQGYSRPPMREFAPMPDTI
tara:strand:- start:599 stop:1558 length:960 start_codon:yes stop_codon:yes gene_type:complete